MSTPNQQPRQELDLSGDFIHWTEANGGSATAEELADGTQVMVCHLDFESAPAPMVEPIPTRLPIAAGRAALAA